LRVKQWDVRYVVGISLKRGEMRGTKSIGTLVFVTATAFAGERMKVAVCNTGEIPRRVIASSEAEAAYVFRTVGVDIHWTDCGEEIGAPDARMRPDFIVRVQMGGKVAKAGAVSLEAMGRAFMDEKEYGFMADAYFGAIRDLTVLFPYTTSEQLLGYVMTHELGHLLIGAGHRPHGIMRASLGKSELEELNRRHLNFNDGERATILRNLQTRKAARQEN